MLLGLLQYSQLGLPAINKSGNISSLVDNGVGDYTFNFTTSLQDNNYVIGSGAVEHQGSTRAKSIDLFSTASILPTSCRIVTTLGQVGNADFGHVSLNFVR